MIVCERDETLGLWQASVQGSEWWCASRTCPLRAIHGAIGNALFWMRCDADDAAARRRAAPLKRLLRKRRRCA